MRRSLVPILFAKPGWVLPGATVDMDFANNRAWRKGNGLTLPASLLTTTRASTGYAATSSGLLASFANNIPRITDLGLLVEQAATNLALQSTFNGTWTASAATLTVNAVTSPDGTVNAATLVENSASAQHYALQTFTKAASSLAYTGSVYAKPIGGRLIAVQLDDGTNGVTLFFNTTTGAVGSSVPFGAGFAQTSGTITAASGGFYRCSLSVTSTTSTAIRMVVLLASSDGTTNYLGSGTGGASLFGAQLEQNAFPTSYIPTTTVAVTRAADVITLAGAALAVARPATGWLVAKLPQGATSQSYTLVRKVSPSDAYLFAQASTTASALVSSSGVANATIGGGGTFAGSVRYAVTWDGTGIANAANGGTVSSGATPFGATDASPMYLGSSGSGNNSINSYISRLAIGNTRLTNAQIQALAQ